MAEKVDQDVRETAAVTMVLAEMRDLVIGGKMDDHPSVKAFARMKAAGRQQGLREAVEVAQKHHEDAVDAEWVATGSVLDAITALIEGEGE